MVLLALLLEAYLFLYFFTKKRFTLEVYYKWMMYTGGPALIVNNGNYNSNVGYAIGYYNNSYKSFWKGTTRSQSNAPSGGDQSSRIRVTHDEDVSPKTHFYNNGTEYTISNNDISVPTPSGNFTVTSPSSIVIINEVHMWDGVVLP